MNVIGKYKVQRCLVKIFTLKIKLSYFTNFKSRVIEFTSLNERWEICCFISSKICILLFIDFITYETFNIVCEWFPFLTQYKLITSLKGRGMVNPHE